MTAPIRAELFGDPTLLIPAINYRLVVLEIVLDFREFHDDPLAPRRRGLALVQPTAEAPQAVPTVLLDPDCLYVAHVVSFLLEVKALRPDPESKSDSRLPNASAACFG